MGLDSLRKLRAQEQERIASYDRVKTERLVIKPGEKVEVVFLEELEETAETHTVREWAINGNGNFRSLLDTSDQEGGCLAAELQRKFRELDLDKTKFAAKVGWKVYFSVVKVGEPDKTYFFAQSATSSLVETLLEDVADEGGITGAVYRISKGASLSDSWTIRRTKNEVPTVTAKPYSIKDLVIDVKPEDQAKYLAAVMPEQFVAPVEKEASAAPVVADTEW
jgi:hypothetical protein